jgi:hypothetical protein
MYDGIWGQMQTIFEPSKGVPRKRQSQKKSIWLGSSALICHEEHGAHAPK